MENSSTERKAAQPPRSRTVGASKRRVFSRNVKPFPRQSLVIRLLYPAAQSTEGILLLLLSSLIISSCRPSCKFLHSYSVSNDSRWLRKRGLLLSFCILFHNGQVMGKEEIGHWGQGRLLFSHDIRGYRSERVCMNACAVCFTGPTLSRL